MSVPRRNNICYWRYRAASIIREEKEGRGLGTARWLGILLYKSLIPKLWKQRLRHSHSMPLLTATGPQSLQGASEAMQMSQQIRFTRSLSLWAPFPCVRYYDLTLLKQRADSDMGDSGRTHPFLTTPIAGAGTAQDPELHWLSLHQQASQHELPQHILMGVSNTFFFPPLSTEWDRSSGGQEG